MKSVGHKTLETMAFAKWYNKWLFSLIQPFLGNEILEVGAGIGNFTDLLSSVGNVTAIDVERKYIDNLIVRSGRKISVGIGDIEKGTYFFKQKKFDTVVCLNVLEHINHDADALENIYGLLKTSGKFILLVPAHKILFSNFDKELGHFRRYSKKEIEVKLKKAGFKEISVRYLNWWAAVGWFFFLKLLERNIMPKPPVVIFDVFGQLFLLPEKFIKMPFGLSVFAIAQKK